MDDDQYRDHLVDTAKELLEEQAEQRDAEDLAQGVPRSRNARERPEPDEPSERGLEEDVGPDSRQSVELEFLARHRMDMDNEELEAFLRGDSDFQQELREVDWDRFADWEERVLLQRHSEASPSELADQLDRDAQVIKLKLRQLGLDVQE